jgi:hypothetical protein
MSMSETRTSSRVLGFRWGKKQGAHQVAEARGGAGDARWRRGLAGWRFNAANGNDDDISIHRSFRGEDRRWVGSEEVRWTKQEMRVTGEGGEVVRRERDKTVVSSGEREEKDDALITITCSG